MDEFSLKDQSMADTHKVKNEPFNLTQSDQDTATLEVSNQHQHPLTPTGTFDVIIMGGGLAGLTLAWQLYRARPETSILVVEKNSFPVPEAAFKVGESTLEIGAFYFSQVLGFKEHLQKQQLPKFGVRFFFTAGDNSDITRRVEAGRRSFSKVLTYQLDRGRFENFLARQCGEAGITVLDGAEIAGVELDQPLHRVKVRRGNEIMNFEGRWVTDASGRRSLLKRQLGLEKVNEHNVNSAWFRIGSLEDITEWSNDRDWQNRVPNKMRWLSTNHLMGKGYWVWLIPLGSGSISIGIVADPRYHSFDRINTFERALDWLKEFEPQCAARVEAKKNKLQDFRVLKNFSYRCKQIFSEDRWCLTGDAGVFLDPLYSPGSDFIAVNNTLITRLIVTDLEGFPGERLVTESNKFFLQFYEFYLLSFEGQYGLFGNPQVAMAKVLWDSALYWSFNAFLFFHGSLCNLEFMGAIYPVILHFFRLHRSMQLFFREWDKQDQTPWQDGYVDFQNLDFMKHRTDDLLKRMDENEVLERCLKNLAIMEEICRKMHLKAGIPMPDLKAVEAGNESGEKLTANGSDNTNLGPELTPEMVLFSQALPDLPADETLDQLGEIWFEKFCAFANQTVNV